MPTWIGFGKSAIACACEDRRNGWLNFAGRVGRKSSSLASCFRLFYIRKKMSHHKAADGAIREKRFGNEGPVLPDQRDAEALALDEKRIPFKDVPLRATVDTASERDLTFGTMLRGSAASQLTVFGKLFRSIRCRYQLTRGECRAQGSPHQCVGRLRNLVNAS